jgi:hypothetical protein
MTMAARPAIQPEVSIATSLHAASGKGLLIDSSMIRILLAVDVQYKRRWPAGARVTWLFSAEANRDAGVNPAAFLPPDHAEWIACATVIRNRGSK